MSFNGLNDDTCEKEFSVKQSVGPGNYKLQQPLICNNTYQENPSIRMQKNGVSMHQTSKWRFYDGPVDVESELLNITRDASKCPSKKYIPECSECNCIFMDKAGGSITHNLCSQCLEKNIKNGKLCGDKNLVDFPTQNFPMQYTRTYQTPLRGVGINRFEYPCIDPQANLFFPGKIQRSSRMMAKDHFTKCTNK